ncbi:MAG: phage tail protein [Thiomonas sp.]
MPVYQYGQTLPQAPDLYVNIVPPRTILINGIPTGILGLVGVASWGPTNAPMVIGDPATAALSLGNMTVRSHDLATACTLAFGEFCSQIAAVRVSDGTDTAASVTMMDTETTPVAALTLTAKYTGIVGNTISAQFATGTAANSYKLIIQRAGYTPEIFDNLTGTGNALYVAAANAVNNGQSGVRGPSSIVTATAGAGTGAPNLNSYTLAGGTDGASNVTDTTLLGADGTTRTGMYALRGSNASNFTLLDHTTSTHWPAILSFAEQIGAYAHQANPPSTSIANSATALTSAGVDGYGLKALVGDWGYFYDSLNGQQRMLSPATWSAAKAASLIPPYSNLNKRLFTLIATQRSQTQIPYSSAEIQQAFTSRLDVIAANSPGGPYFSARTGLNTSSNPTQNDDTYTKMTNYLAFSLAQSSLGAVVGQPQTADLRKQVKGALDGFLLDQFGQGWIGDPNNPTAQGAFSVVCDATNNPATRVALGYLQADVKVKYLNTVRFFVVNMEGGGAVTVTSNAPQ